VSNSLQLDIEMESNLNQDPVAVRPKPTPLPARVRIVLEEDENIPPGGLYLGLNGMGYKLAPGVEVDVPVGIIDILDNAVMSVPVLDPISRQTVAYRDKRRYSYRLIK
jgi:hypothetical protein